MKEHFLLDPAIVFLNHGSYGACPRPVFDAWQDWQREMERNPVEFLARRSAGLLRHARECLAGYLGADADEMVFVSNATTGVNIVAKSLALKEGDEVLTTDLDAYSKFSRDTLLHLPHVKDLHTSFSLGEVKATAALPLTHLRPAPA